MSTCAALTPTLILTFDLIELKADTTVSHLVGNVQTNIGFLHSPS